MVIVPMLAVPPPFISVVILVVLRRPMTIIPVPVVPRGPMTVVVIVSSVVLPSSTVMVSIPVPFAVTVTVAIPVPFLFLVAVVAATVSVSISVSVSFTVSFVLAVFVFVFSVFRGLLAFTAGGGSTILRSFLLANALLLTFDELREGGPTSLFVFERLILAQVFKEWYGLSNVQKSSRNVEGGFSPPHRTG